MATPDIGVEVATAFLRDQIGECEDVELIGEGAWSRCFGFRRRGAELVVRFGHQLDDFERDRRASEWRSDELPIPEVLDIGAAFDGHYAISTRVRGTTLESLDVDGWRLITPAFLRALDALRKVPVVAALPFNPNDQGHHASWREALLAVSVDSPTSRGHGWSGRLQQSERGAEAFDEAFARLEEISRDLVVTPHVVHADLVNRNVLVDGHTITGIFDWGCMFGGDFLYDLAAIVFWTPWYSALDDFDLLDAALRHFDDQGADLHDLERRLEACALHIGLVHVAFNASLGDWATLDLTADRTMSYVGRSGRH